MTNIVPVKKKYIIGTRGSLLALTQCGQIKDQLEELTGDEFELKVIKTQGDQIVDKPLWQLEGKDFFTKELDAELLEKKIDLVVHSYKDLGSDRPQGIKLAAITKRAYAQDILLIKKTTVEKLSQKTEFIVGTSSPRRIVNIESQLSQFLPHGNNLEVKTKMLRGNVNTRIGKLVEDQYDAIVLALPGIERLAITQSSRIELEALLEGMTFMILPQSIFPSAASQGALGIECLEDRDDNGELLEKLQKVQDKDTVSEVSRERHAFANYGGGCHLAVGINVMKAGDYYLHVHRGAVDDKTVAEIHLEGSFPSPDKKTKAFIGMPASKLEKDGELNEFTPCRLLKKTELKLEQLPEGDTLISSSYGMNNLEKASGAIFTAGTKTWQQLAQKGLWANASCDSLGEAYLENIRNSKTLEIMLGANRSLNILTNEEGYSKYGNILGAYKKEILELSQAEEDELLNCDTFYWTSFSQYQAYTQKYPKIAEGFHCCGLGKTLEAFKEREISVRPFSSITEFKNWFKK
ncbi:hydroxymethylbilane synthase [Bacteriovorax sp. DB6_IX]|uniref:hydroxymethylbilane synthase n=1 Tax=Bacteriovorax sp. DB6_IX TaxID=1353530 RepID=UPI00038A5154|nr:hydroxymethylbilane synthase [Bacteriovorax sp. DB6_IX]EQC43171.1 hydroxymethylbilane synthase [Bacteriovorax sp. DB6_IX]